MSDVATRPRSSGLLADLDNRPSAPWMPDPSQFLTSADEFRIVVTCRIGRRDFTLAIPHSSIPWVMAAEQAFSRIAALPDNWDSYSARSISQETLDFAFSKVVELQNNYPGLAIPQIGPTVMGGVEIEWHDYGSDLEIQIEAPDQISGFFHDGATDRDWEGPVQANFREVSDYLQRFVR